MGKYRRSGQVVIYLPDTDAGIYVGKGVLRLPEDGSSAYIELDPEISPHDVQNICGEAYVDAEFQIEETFRINTLYRLDVPRLVYEGPAMARVSAGKRLFIDRDKIAYVPNSDVAPIRRLG